MFRPSEYYEVNEKNNLLISIKQFIIYMIKNSTINYQLPTKYEIILKTTTLPIIIINRLFTIIVGIQDYNKVFFKYLS